MAEGIRKNNLIDPCYVKSRRWRALSFQGTLHLSSHNIFLYILCAEVLIRKLLKGSFTCAQKTPHGAILKLSEKKLDGII